MGDSGLILDVWRLRQGQHGLHAWYYCSRLVDFSKKVAGFELEEAGAAERLEPLCRENCLCRSRVLLKVRRGAAMDCRAQVLSVM